MMNVKKVECAGGLAEIRKEVIMFRCIGLVRIIRNNHQASLRGA